MQKRVLFVLVGLLMLTGCIELRKALNPQNDATEQEPDYGPVITDDDTDPDDDVADDAAEDDGDSDEQEPADEGIPELSADLDEVVTASGLRYIDIIEGSAPPPVEGDQVEVHYTGWLEDGTKFDSSRDRDDPFVFTLGVGDVIDGWDEGIATMSAGGQRRLIIPPDLAYGPDGRPPSIPANSTLVFDVELLSVLAR